MQYCPHKLHSLRDEAAGCEQTQGFLYKEQPASRHHIPRHSRSSVLTTKAMMSSATICSLLLLSMLWMDMAMAGSSFLSPEHQKAQQRKESKKPPAKLQPRALEGWLHPEDRGQAEEAEEELEIRGGHPASLGFCHVYRFNAPFDVGIKLSGAQYQQHGRALGKFLQDILWEEVKEAPADK